MKIELRDYQSQAFDQARELIRQGKRRILIVAPTGSGKTVLASALMEMTREKGNRATFVVDRLSLIDQTSAVFDRYGLEHGVVQGNHYRFRAYEPIQLCSVQTLAKRRWPDSQVDVFDEAHVLHVCHKHRMQGDSIVIGLTATPFTRGLAKYFDAVINVTTTRKLITDGWLSDYRIFSCAEPDMTDVKVKSTGEWDDKQASGKALEIVGDVVAEYVKHGEGRKFICSAVDTAHVEELARQFTAAGIQVATYTYKDRADDRADTTKEFRKPDSHIRGLITVTAASRGFDVPDVSCIIMARPLRKSLAEHIQLFGRGLRIAQGKTDCLVLDHAGNCLARGMRVLTRRGLVEIQNVTLSDEVWDGHEFVRHGGAVCRGRKRVIEYAGLVATPDHRVKANGVWRTFGDCAKEQASIVTTGIGGAAVRERDGYLTGPRLAWPTRSSHGALSLRMRDLWLPVGHFVEQLARRSHEWLPSVQPTAAVPKVAVCARPGYAVQVHESERERVRKLWGARNTLRIFIACGVRALDRAGTWAARQAARNGLGSYRQRWELFARQSALGIASAQFMQSTCGEMGAEDARISTRASTYPIRRRHVDDVHAAWNVGRANRDAVVEAIQETEREVWDILDCGSRNCFTCEGLLVHNCARFFEACESFFDAGADELDDGKKRERKTPIKAEAEPMKCPQCRALHRPSPVCPCCGHQYPRRETVRHVPGTLKELVAGGYRRELSEKIWPQICGYVRERRTDDSGRRQALAIYKEITGSWPLTDWERTESVPPSIEVRNKIRANQIRYSRGRAKANKQQLFETNARAAT